MQMPSKAALDSLSFAHQNFGCRLRHLELSLNAALQCPDNTPFYMDVDFEVDAFARLLMWRQEHCTMQRLTAAEVEELLRWVTQGLQIETHIAAYLAAHPESAASIPPEAWEAQPDEARYLYWNLLLLYQDGTAQRVSGQGGLPMWLDRLVQKLMACVPEEAGCQES